MRGYADRFGQLLSCNACTASHGVSPYSSIFDDFRAEFTFDSIAISWRKHFRARAAGALLIR
jgi:hypothetical protein